ncbi:MAG: arylsulfotransferase family protein, partial [Streptosporangiaceae bacterium]
QIDVFPRPGTPTASAETTISFRGIAPNEIGDIEVKGSRSGKHDGSFTAHSDGEGASFVPDKPFASGETVRVRTDLNLRGAREGNFRFHIAVPASREKDAPTRATGAAGGGSNDELSHPAHFRTYASTPDLHPPKLDIKKRTEGQNAPGYIFIAPKNPRKKTVPAGPMIVDNAGRVVWFHQLEKRTLATNFRVREHHGKRVLTWWQGHTAYGHGFGEEVIADHSYRVVKRVHAGNGYAADLHAFVLTPQDTAWFTVYNPVRWHGRPVLEGVVQEVDIKTGAVLYEWHSLAHISLDESYGDPIKDPDHFLDYLHPNSIDITHGGDILLSGRHTSTVYKIDRQTGKIIWRLGGKKSDFDIPKAATFHYQHDVQLRSDGDLTLFDNASVSKKDASHVHSRGLVLRLDTDAMTATLVRQYAPPGGLLATSQGNVQPLPDGDVFIGWGSTGDYTEYKHGAVSLDARLPSGLDTYRAFRFRWEGHPSDKPSVAAKAAPDGGVSVSASWNGATDVATWQILAGPAPDELRPVRTVPWDGLETTLTMPREAAYVAARALGASGKKLGVSSPTQVRR